MGNHFEKDMIGNKCLMVGVESGFIYVEIIFVVVVVGKSSAFVTVCIYIKYGFKMV